MIRVSVHAIERYMERVQACTHDEARTALSSAVVKLAVAFGAGCVRLPGGQRIIIKNGDVVTVLPASDYRRQVRRQGLSRYGRGNHHEEN